MLKVISNSLILLIAAGCQLLFFLLTARVLGAAQFGELRPLLAFAVPASELVGLGCADRLTQRVSRYKPLFQPLFASSLASIALTGPPLAFITTMFCAYVITPNLALSSIILIVFSEAILIRVLFLSEQAFIAHDKSIYANLERLSLALVKCGFILGFFLWGGATLSLFALFYSLTILSSTIIVLGVTIRLYGRPKFRKKAGYLFFGPSFSINQFGRALAQSIDRISLVFILTSEQLGIYSAGARVLQAVLVPINAVMRDVCPGYFRAGRNGIKQSYLFARSIFKKVAAISILSSLGAGFLAAVLPLLLGNQYVDSSKVGIMMAISGVFIAIQYMAGDILMGANKQALRAKVSLSMLMISTLLITGTSYFFQVEGATWAFGCAQCLTALVMAVIVALELRKAKK